MEAKPPPGGEVGFSSEQKVREGTDMTSHHGATWMTLLVHRDRFFQLSLPRDLVRLGARSPAIVHGSPGYCGAGGVRGSEGGLPCPVLPEPTQLSLHCAFPFQHGVGGRCQKKNSDSLWVISSAAEQ